MLVCETCREKKNWEPSQELAIGECKFCKQKRMCNVRNETELNRGDRRYAR